MQELVKILELTGSLITWETQINNMTAQGWIVKFGPVSVLDTTIYVWKNIVLLYTEQL